MKKRITGLLMITIVFIMAFPAAAGEAAALVEDLPTVQAYTDEKVSDEDILKIVTAGINTPSAFNSQPWHFSVVTDSEVLELIAGGGDMSSNNKAGITDAPLAIVISCVEGSEYDAGLATQTMSIEAQLLGYGTKIIESVQPTLNGEKREQFSEILGIPEGMYGLAVMIVGRENPAPDAVSAPTGRNPMEEMVSFIGP